LLHQGDRPVAHLVEITLRRRWLVVRHVRAPPNPEYRFRADTWNF
jgi:hypothetical protein